MTSHQEDAANRLLNAQRTGCPQAITSAEAYQRFQASRVTAAAARQHETNRLHFIGPAGREDERQAAAHSPYHL